MRPFTASEFNSNKKTEEAGGPEKCAAFQRPANGWPALAQGLLGRAAFGSPKACPRLTQGLLKACSRLARKGWLRHANQKLARAFSQGLSESRPRLLGDVPKACRKLTESLPNACRQRTESLLNACRKLPESLRKAYRTLTESLRNACRTLAEGLRKACRKPAHGVFEASPGVPKACPLGAEGHRTVMLSRVDTSVFQHYFSYLLFELAYL